MFIPRSWLILYLCVCIPLQHDAVRVTVRDSVLEVVQGDYITLSCSFFTSNPLSRLNIIWTVEPFSRPDSPMQVIVYDHGQVIEDLSLTGRVGFPGLPWSADIVLNDTRISDAGVYRCMVNNPPERGDPGIGELILNVMVPPSLPVCRWDGDIAAGGSVTLSCMVTEGVPRPDIHWDKMTSERHSLPIHMDGDLRLSGSVQIANVSSQTSGLYRCSATNILGTQNCYVNLSIYRPPDSTPGILQGVLLSLSMVLLLAALLVLMLWLRRTGQDGKCRERKKEEECYNEIRYTPSLMKRSFV